MSKVRYVDGNVVFLMLTSLKDHYIGVWGREVVPKAKYFANELQNLLINETKTGEHEVEKCGCIANIWEVCVTLKITSKF